MYWLIKLSVCFDYPAGSFPRKEATSHLPLPATSGLYQVQRQQISLHQRLQKHRLLTLERVWGNRGMEEGNTWKQDSTRRRITSAIAPLCSFLFFTLMHFALQKRCYPASPQMPTYSQCHKVYVRITGLPWHPLHTLDSKNKGSFITRSLCWVHANRLLC